MTCFFFKSLLCWAGLNPETDWRGMRLVKPSKRSQAGVGALTVRFITRRFIGDYDPTLEMIYRHVAVIDGEMVHFEILDTAGQVSSAGKTPREQSSLPGKAGPALPLA
uniref:small monomeric GTPase n=1 Tax=Catharus ustulatus TaxID=91951 RepID=A0A8C3UV06_CATUS